MRAIKRTIITQSASSGNRGARHDRSGQGDSCPPRNRDLRGLAHPKQEIRVRNLRHCHRLRVDKRTLALAADRTARLRALFCWSVSACPCSYAGGLSSEAGCAIAGIGASTAATTARMKNIGVVVLFIVWFDVARGRKLAVGVGHPSILDLENQGNERPAIRPTNVTPSVGVSSAVYDSEPDAFPA